MDTMQILCTLLEVRSFLGVFSDLIPHSITHSDTVIINADLHTQKFSYWLAIHSKLLSYSSYYFDSYGFSCLCLLSKNSWEAIFVWYIKTVQLQCSTSTFCGKYCCVFDLYMDRGCTPKQFIGIFRAGIADRQIVQMFKSEFGPLCRETRGEQCNSNMNTRYITTHDSFIIYFYID